jgi:hypothetical protein
VWLVAELLGFVSSVEAVELVGETAKDKIHLAFALLSNQGGLRTIPYVSPKLCTPVLQTKSQSSVSGLGPNPSLSDSAIYECAVGLLIERRPLIRGLKVFLGVDRAAYFKRKTIIR